MQALREYISESGPFDRVCYAGDNVNDVCPALDVLSAKDLFFPRQGCPLVDEVEKADKDIAAKIVPWSDGSQIWNAISQSWKNRSIKML